MEKVKCLQMVGRARAKDSTDRKTLYIKRLDKGEIEKRIKDLERRQNAYHDYERAYRNSYTYAGCESRFLSRYHEWEDAKKWFGISAYERMRFYINEIAKALTDKKVPCYKSICDGMNDESSSENEQQNGKKRIGQKYLEYQLSWFGKEYCEGDDITFADKERAKKEFIAFLEKYVEGEPIDKEKQKMFRNEFTKLYDLAYGRADRNLNRDYGIRKMNGLLEDQHLDYEIKSGETGWEVCICDEE